MQFPYHQILFQGTIHSKIENWYATTPNLGFMVCSFLCKQLGESQMRFVFLNYVENNELFKIKKLRE